MKKATLILIFLVIAVGAMASPTFHPTLPPDGYHIVKDVAHFTNNALNQGWYFLTGRFMF